VSRIWDALKQAELDRTRTAGRKSAREPKSDGAERRKSQRWEQPVPLLVYGSDAEKQPFHEETMTIDINDDGCSLALETHVSRGQRLFIINMRNQAERECRVIHVGRRTRGKYRVGVNFLRPGAAGAGLLPSPDFWHGT
jgi:PilZ domain-containing protein